MLSTAGKHNYEHHMQGGSSNGTGSRINGIHKENTRDCSSDGFISRKSCLHDLGPIRDSNASTKSY